MPRRLPSLNAVRASRPPPARELHPGRGGALRDPGRGQPPGSVAQLALGLKLFNRERQRLVITESREYLNVVRDAFDRIAIGTVAVAAAELGVLTVSTSPLLAAKWLVHRLAASRRPFRRLLRVSATLHHVDFARGHRPGGPARRRALDRAARDAALQRGAVPGVQPAARHRRTPSEPSSLDLLGFPLLHLDDRTTWATWLEAAGVGDAEALHGPVMNRASMVIDAAVDGQGVTLARTTLAAWDLINGRHPTVRPCPAVKSYWIVTQGIRRAAEDRHLPRLAARQPPTTRGAPRRSTLERTGSSAASRLLISTIAQARDVRKLRRVRGPDMLPFTHERSSTSSASTIPRSGRRRSWPICSAGRSSFCCCARRPGRQSQPPSSG